VSVAKVWAVSGQLFITSKNKLMKNFLKFGILSGGGWLLDCGILLALSQTLGIALSYANFISSSVAALVVFTVSRFLIFDSSTEQSLLKTGIYFCYTCGIIFAASTVIGPILRLIRYSSQYLEIWPTAGQAAFLAKVLITPPQLLVNFIMSRYLSTTRY
jgi:putative flippase GtrA